LLVFSVLRLNGELVKALDFPEELAVLMKSESLVYGKAIRALGIRPE
jgi:hypothetical protein